MHLDAGELIYSPSDLTLYMSSPFACWLEQLALTQPEWLSVADEADALLDVLKDMGGTHEAEVLHAFIEQGLMVADLSSSQQPVEDTLIAMRGGIDLIYQAQLRADGFHGHADFLVKVAGQSNLGSYYYEVWESKLARLVKPFFIIQLCCYAQLLEAAQGIRPEFISVVLGNKEQQRFRTNDFYYFYLQLKSAFLAEQQHFNPQQLPDPAASKSWGRWSTYAQELLKRSDHLQQVATITSAQIKKLNKAGLATMSSLASTSISWVKGIKPEVFSRLQAQAKLQQASVGKDVPRYELINNSAAAKSGLALLPPLSPQDIFFDIEGFPLVEGGLEYLWGAVYFDEQGNRQYKDFWAHNREEEKNAFQAFIAWAYQRWLAEPAMHIYHYASYEITACRKLMGRYGVAEYEVDQLLRNEVFVDLYKVVKGAFLIGEPRYSIKNVEHLYRAARETLVGSGGDSVVVYERWREQPDGESWQDSPILNDIRLYNIDDCHSTQELVVWLSSQQQQHQIAYLGKTEVVMPTEHEALSARLLLRDRLLQQAQHMRNTSTGHADTAELFAWSIEFHQREMKPMFWRLFDRLGSDGEALLHDIDCLAHCLRTDTPPHKPSPRARNLAYEYSFDLEQEFKAGAKTYVILGAEDEQGGWVKVTYLPELSRLGQGLVMLQMSQPVDGAISLLPFDHINNTVLVDAIARQAQAFEHQLLANTAITDFLAKAIPRIKHHQAGAAIAPSNEPQQRLAQITTAVVNLDNSYLTIQGPPGAGKTYTGKHLIAELVRRGKTVGIASNSHKAINNLLISTAHYCQQAGIKGYFACSQNTDKTIEQLDIAVLESKKIIDFIQPGAVVGATAWGFAREELAQAFDYLFIDEAGQVSVANLIAMSEAAHNLVLMGDQMQLGQPSQGTHPGQSGLSILDYLLHTTPTIPDAMGVFLKTTYRMHSAVNRFISNAIYEGKLESVQENDLQRIIIPDNYQGILNKEAGIIAQPVFHEGNTQASDEEVACIVDLAQQLIGRMFQAKDGTSHPLDWNDMLFVAPYNHQVTKLQQALGEQARVGSVDKFQGQEAPIVFLSMCASSADESPRGLNFLLDKNRINVAISRAQCLAIVVYSPTLLTTMPDNLAQMTMLNMFCQLVNVRVPVKTVGPGAPPYVSRGI